jgi:hypothetical protein
VSTFDQEGNIYRICCSTGVFYYFVKVILTETAFYRDLRKLKQPSPNATRAEARQVNAWLAACLAAVSRSRTSRFILNLTL